MLPSSPSAFLVCVTCIIPCIISLPYILSYKMLACCQIFLNFDDVSFPLCGLWWHAFFCECHVHVIPCFPFIHWQQCSVVCLTVQAEILHLHMCFHGTGMLELIFLQQGWLKVSSRRLWTHIRTSHLLIRLYKAQDKWYLSSSFLVLTLI